MCLHYGQTQIYHGKAILKTHRRVRSLCLLVLVPHRDARLLLRGWSASLFKAGFPGAYSFPWVAPLAALSRPLSAEELKNCALVLRKESLGVNGGKMKGINTAGGVSSLPFPGNAFSDGFGGTGVLSGPGIDLTLCPGALSATVTAKIAGFFSPLVIGACLGKSAIFGEGTFPPPPEISFRVAALANMIYRPLHVKGPDNEGDGFSFEWKIGKLHWLPVMRKHSPVFQVYTGPKV